MALSLGMRAASGSYLAGDEANEQPKLGGYAVFDVGGRFRIAGHAELFGTITNIFDRRYATFGTFSPTSDVFIAEAPGASNPRSLSPAEPRAFMVGLRIAFSPDRPSVPLDATGEAL